MSKSIRIIAGLVLLLALPTLGCGGGDESGTGASVGTNVSDIPGRPLSKDEFVERAEEICKKADDQVYDEAVVYRERHEKKEREKLGNIPFEEKLIRLVVFPSIRKQAKEIEALGIPVGEEKNVKALLAAIALGMKKAEKDPYEIEGEDPSKYPFAKYSELAREYGFGECANLA